MATKQNETAKALGAKIREARRAAQLSQEQLAKKLRKKQPEISAWERGDHEPQLLTIKRIAKALHVSIAELLDAA